MVGLQMQAHQEVSSGNTVQAREGMGDPLVVVDTKTGIRSGRGISLCRNNVIYCLQSVRCHFSSRTPWDRSCSLHLFSGNYSNGTFRSHKWVGSSWIEIRP